ncbi:tetracycline resistance protein [Fusarium denticulatum]|uniref:Tetracycline resistance protein n=1 Tax=Fusarium denticulatum TaxID=48507 RepID=A0A8H5ULM7_9HYPO|nr:tetracycline resistance protein [Fusarium denticulatum]
MATSRSYPTQALELETLSLTHEADATPKKPNPALSTTGRRLGSRNDHEDEHDNFTGSGDEAAPSRATLVVEKWNEPIGNAFRVGAVYWSLFVSGANDAAYGALIPYLETYYELSYLVVSLIFLSPFVGFIVSAAVNNYLHMNIGQRWIAFMCGGCHALTYLILSQHPPYPVLVLAYVLAGLGNGIGLAAWNSYIGNLARSNELLGFMHASYGLGGTVSPLIATSMITQANLGWYDFYYVLLGMAVLETATLTYSFWPKTAQKYREAVHTEGTRNEGTRAALFVKPHARVVWLCAFFLLGYVGTEVALGGWVVQFMLRVRNADPFDAGMTAVGFWLGITIGRLVLGMVIPKIGVKLSLMIFIPITMGLQLIFWLVPQFHVSAVAVSLQGFFLGPMFPCVIVALTMLLPRHLHVSAIGFAAAFGGSGAAVLPFAVGAIAQAKGVQRRHGGIQALVNDQEVAEDRPNVGQRPIITLDTTAFNDLAPETLLLGVGESGEPSQRRGHSPSLDAKDEEAQKEHLKDRMGFPRIASVGKNSGRKSPSSPTRTDTGPPRWSEDYRKPSSRHAYQAPTPDVGLRLPIGSPSPPPAYTPEGKAIVWPIAAKDCHKGRKEIARERRRSGTLIESLTLATQRQVT